MKIYLLISAVFCSVSCPIFIDMGEWFSAFYTGIIGAAVWLLLIISRNDYIKNKPFYRILEITYENHIEYWCEKSVRFLGIHLFWDKTTIAYFRNLESAKKEMRDMVGRKLKTILDTY